MCSWWMQVEQPFQGHVQVKVEAAAELETTKKQSVTPWHQVE